MAHYRINTMVGTTSAPPIPESLAWLSRYDGRLGPAINLAQAVPGTPPPAELLDRLAESARLPTSTAYGPIAGDPVLREALADDMRRVYRSDTTAADIAITAGCNQAFFVAMMALASAGDEILLPQPWYFNHKMTLDMLGIRARPLSCRAQDGFVPTVEDARRVIGPQTRAIVLVTPNNPTGAIYPDAVLHAFRDLCHDSGIALVLDETYRDFLSEAMSQPHTLLETPDWRSEVIHLYSFSKSYAIPGHRLGAIIASPAFIDEAAKVMDCVQICPPRPPQAPIAWAVSAMADWREETRQQINERASVFRKAVDQVPGWSISAIGAYFAFVRPPVSGSMRAFAEHMAQRVGVLVLPGDYFGDADSSRDHLRFAFANVGSESIELLPERLTDLQQEEQ